MKSESNNKRPSRCLARLVRDLHSEAAKNGITITPTETMDDKCPDCGSEHGELFHVEEWARTYCDECLDRELLKYLPNVKEHATLSAGASVDHGAEVGITEDHVNRAADRGCCVSTCSISSFLLKGWRHKDPAVKVMKWLAIFNAIMVVAFLIYKLTT